MAIEIYNVSFHWAYIKLSSVVKLFCFNHQNSKWSNRKNISQKIQQWLLTKPITHWKSCLNLWKRSNFCFYFMTHELRKINSIWVHYFSTYTQVWTVNVWLIMSRAQRYINKNRVRYRYLDSWEWGEAKN